LILAAHGRREEAGPAHAEVVVVHVRARRAIPPVEIHLRIDAREHGCGFAGITAALRMACETNAWLK
jgi:hypothetical protein